MVSNHESFVNPFYPGLAMNARINAADFPTCMIRDHTARVLNGTRAWRMTYKMLECMSYPLLGSMFLFASK